MCLLVCVANMTQVVLCGAGCKGMSCAAIKGCIWLQKTPGVVVAENTACAHLCLVAKDTRCHGCSWLQKTPDAMVVAGCKRHLMPWL